jgi:hypothetical protein
MLAIAACAAVSVLIGAPAHAADPPVIVDAITAPNSGIFQVHILAEAGVADVIARVIDTTNAAEIAVVHDFSLDFGTGQDGYWQSSQPVALPHLGTYQLDVSVTDNDGVHVDRQAAGYFNSTVRLSFGDLKMTGHVDYVHREVTVSGQLLGTWPDGTVRPVAGWPIEVETYRGGPFDGDTDAHGKFKIKAAIQNVDEFVYLYSNYVPGQPYYLPANGDLGKVAVTQAPTRLTLNVDPKRILAGESVTLTGRATWLSPTGWQPTPNALVVLWLCDVNGANCNSNLGYLQTDAAGQFSTTVAPYRTGRILAGTNNDDPFITTKTITSKPVTVLQLANLADFTAVRDTPAQVTVTGHLNIPGNLTPALIPVDIQFQGATGGWQTITTVEAGLNPHEQAGILFTATVDSSTAGRWRARYAGVPNEFQSATSQSVHVG